MWVYHGSTVVVKKPEIRVERYHKDFGYGFYCTRLEAQAERWATRFGDGYVNVFSYMPDERLSTLRFAEMTDQWLDFIAACRSGQPHAYDVVEGPMADDTIFNYVQDFLDGRITREAFWSLARFKHPTHQICFNTVSALGTIRFEEARRVYERI